MTSIPECTPDLLRTLFLFESLSDERLRYLRVYSEGRTYAPATGYYSVYGATGIEKAENDLLAGSDDRSRATDVLRLVRVP